MKVLDITTKVRDLPKVAREDGSTFKFDSADKTKVPVILVGEINCEVLTKATTGEKCSFKQKCVDSALYKDGGGRGAEIITGEAKGSIPNCKAVLQTCEGHTSSCPRTRHQLAASSNR